LWVGVRARALESGVSVNEYIVSALLPGPVEHAPVTGEVVVIPAGSANLAIADDGLEYSVGPDDAVRPTGRAVPKRARRGLCSHRVPAGTFCKACGS
jgi:hypothetical protein